MSNITEFPIPTEVLDPAAYPEFKGDKGDKGDPGNPGAKGDTGDQGPAGNGIASIVKTAGDGSPGTSDTYTITFTDATTTTFAVYNGDDGAKGDKGDAGQNFTVDAVGLLSERGTYDAEAEGFSFLATDNGNLYFREGVSGWSDGVPFRGPQGDVGDAGPSAYEVAVAGGFVGDEAAWLLSLKGDKGDTGDTGDQGPTGNGVASIARTSGDGSAGTTDTYTITFSDASTTTFQVVNGADGAKGDTGDTGATGTSISSIARTSGDGSAGTTDTYTITFSDASTTTFQVVNGADGTDGEVTLSTAQTLSAKTFANYTESVFALTGTTPDIKPFNGPIQTWTLTDDSTPTVSDWASGQSLTLLVDDSAAHKITWTSLAPVWVTGGGTAPELNTEGYTHLTFWKVGTTIYGARVGDA